MKNFKRYFERTGTTKAAEKISYIRTLVCGEALQEFDELASQNAGTDNSHLKFIQEGSLGYFPLINTLYKKKRVIRRAMRKPQDIPFKRFAARLT